MNTFLVGGAVRDKLLNLPVKDKDWVVVGAKPEHLLDLGFTQVGADFPVFLHPETKEEYALARTERKSGKGYKGFAVDFNPTVTLEDDLLRRDLTINAIAQSEDGSLIDPFNGQRDLKDKLLRHVSEAFTEDPLRVLRVARFSARFSHLGFRVADETRILMREMVNNGELDSLTPERVWSEMERALTEASPSEFFRELRMIGALKAIFPELDRLFGVPQTMKWHPEVDTGVHTLKALEIATTLTNKAEIRFATLCHDLGKGLTEKQILPSHHGHELSGAALIREVEKKYKWPNKYANVAANVAQFHTHAHTAFVLKPKTILKLFEKLNAFRSKDNLIDFLIACEADAKGRTGLERRSYKQAKYLIHCHSACHNLSAQKFVEEGLTGKAIGQAMRQERILRIAHAIQTFPQAGNNV